MTEKIRLIIQRFTYFYFMWFFTSVLGKVLISGNTPAETGAYLYTPIPYVMSAVAGIGFVVLRYFQDKNNKAEN